MTEQEMLDRMNGTLSAVDGLSPEDQLFVLELAWLTRAAVVRAEAIALGGFAAEQARQLDVLDKMAQLVREDTPDLEAERLYQEGDMVGWLGRLRRDQEAD